MRDCTCVMQDGSLATLRRSAESVYCPVHGECWCGTEQWRHCPIQSPDHLPSSTPPTDSTPQETDHG